MEASILFSRLRAVAAKSSIAPVCQVSTSSIGASILFAVAILVAGKSTPTASAQTVTYAGSGAVNFGSVNVCPSGSNKPPPCSQTMTLTYNVTASGTLGTPKALTTGAPDLDYKLAAGSTCTGTVGQGTTCKVNVIFAPIAPGPRNGAVEIVNTTGNVLATTYIYGSGVGPLIGFGPPASRALGNVSVAPTSYGITVDASGDVFYVGVNSPVYEMMAVNGSVPTNPTVKVLPIGAGFGPNRLAVDGAGNIFFCSNTSEEQVFESVAASEYATIKSISSDFLSPSALAVDGSGNVFVADDRGASVKELLAADGYATAKTLGGGFVFDSPGGTGGLKLDGSVETSSLRIPSFPMANSPAPSWSYRRQTTTTQ